MGITIEKDKLPSKSVRVVTMLTDNVELAKLLEELSYQLIHRLDGTKGKLSNHLRSKLVSQLVLEQLKKIIV